MSINKISPRRNGCWAGRSRSSLSLRFRICGEWRCPDAIFSFLGLTHNIDDGAVYLSWMRQSADGHFFIRNLFTNEPQVARQFNLLFLVMGGLAGLARCAADLGLSFRSGWPLGSG